MESISDRDPGDEDDIFEEPTAEEFASAYVEEVAFDDPFSPEHLKSLSVESAEEAMRQAVAAEFDLGDDFDMQAEKAKMTFVDRLSYITESYPLDEKQNVRFQRMFEETDIKPIRFTIELDEIEQQAILIGLGLITVIGDDERLCGLADRLLRRIKDAAELSFAEMATDADIQARTGWLQAETGNAIARSLGFESVDDLRTEMQRLAENEKEEQGE